MKIPTKPLMVEIIMPLAGTLRVNPLFRNALRQNSEYREDWKNDLERAALFVKCLQQRNHTMRRLMQRLVAIQKDFIAAWRGLPQTVDTRLTFHRAGSA